MSRKLFCSSILEKKDPKKNKLAFQIDEITEVRRRQHTESNFFELKPNSHQRKSVEYQSKCCFLSFS